MRVPAGALNSSGSGTVSSQVTAFRGSGPYFWTPTELEGNASGQRDTTAVMSVVFKSPGVASADGGRRRLSTVEDVTIVVENLIEPFLVTLNRSSALDTTFDKNTAGRQPPQ